MSNQALKYRPDIDGLRAIAVVSVVLFHAFPKTITGGFAGVDIFFVISGFLITSILIQEKEAGSFSYKSFYMRRARRIFPALALVLTATIVAGFFIMVPSDFKVLGKHLTAGSLFSSNFVLLKESGYFDSAAELKPLLHLWSLGIEEQFYLAWPLVLTLALRRKKSALNGLIALTVVSFIINLIYIYSGESAKAFYLPFSRFWELTSGGILAYISRPSATEFSRKNNDAISFLGLALLTGSIFLLKESKYFPGWQAAIPSIGAVLVIAAGPSTWISRKILSNKLMVGIGLISYPLYLWHWPILSFAHIINKSPLPPKTLTMLVASSVILAWATWALLEKKIRHNTSPETTRFLLLSVPAAALIGCTINYTHGLSVRYPNEIRAIAEYDYNGKKEARTGRCFLKPAQSEKDFRDECHETDHSSIKLPSIMLWGDSHAAQLYPGLLSWQKHEPKFLLQQYTASGCPPVLGIKIPKRENCEQINNFILQKIIDNRPDTIIIAGYWDGYKGGEHGKVSIEQIKKSIEKIKSLNIGTIVLVGQVPTWTTPQPKIILELWEKYSIIPSHISYGLQSSSLKTDEEMRSIAIEENIQFISPIDFFCNGSGCATFANIEKTVPVAHDYGHLSDVAAGKLLESAKTMITP